jgi:ABC-type glutathione transport system ATPase component
MTLVLSVRDLSSVPHPSWRADGGHHISFDIAPGEVLGVVGESGAGKSMTGSAIIGLLEPPGRIAGGEILLDGRRIDNLPYEQMRQIRGKQIGAIFQDPLTSLNPVYKVGRQIVEMIQAHEKVSKRDAHQRAIERRGGTGAIIVGVGQDGVVAAIGQAVAKNHQVAERQSPSRTYGGRHQRNRYQPAFNFS